MAAPSLPRYLGLTLAGGGLIVIGAMSTVAALQAFENAVRLAAEFDPFSSILFALLAFALGIGALALGTYALRRRTPPPAASDRIRVVERQFVIWGLLIAGSLLVIGGLGFFALLSAGMAGIRGGFGFAPVAAFGLGIGALAMGLWLRRRPQLR